MQFNIQSSLSLNVGTLRYCCIVHGLLWLFFHPQAKLPMRKTYFHASERTCSGLSLYQTRTRFSISSLTTFWSLPNVILSKRSRWFLCTNISWKGQMSSSAARCGFHKMRKYGHPNRSWAQDSSWTGLLPPGARSQVSSAAGVDGDSLTHC